MPALCDVNALLAICYAEHTHHKTALAWLDRITSPAEAVVCRISQVSVLRLLTTSAVMFGQPLDTAGAWGAYELITADERFTFQSEPTSLEGTFRRIMPAKSKSPKLWQDAYLAAFASCANFQLVTFDSGFRQFKNLDLVLLA